MNEAYLDSIPPLPTVMARVMKFDPMGKDAGSQAMENIISPDMGISAELMRVANSTFYGRSGKVQTLRDAITLLGLKAVKNLVIFLSTKGMTAMLKGDTFKKYLLEYPIVSALVAQDLIKPLESRENPEEAFLAGLFHRIGMSVLALKHRAEYSRLLGSMKQGDSLVDLERRAFGTNHLELGKLVCQKWLLPEQYVAIVSESGAEKMDLPLLPLIVVASAIAKDLTGIQITSEEADLRQKALEAYHMGPETISGFDAQYFAGIKSHPFYQQAMG
jgi:HD-like signal output (HDOD) protein